MAEGGLVVETPKKKQHESRRLLALDIDDHIDPTRRACKTGGGSQTDFIIDL
jgi:hypothetical protein